MADFYIVLDAGRMVGNAILFDNTSRSQKRSYSSLETTNDQEEFQKSQDLSFGNGTMVERERNDETSSIPSQFNGRKKKFFLQGNHQTEINRIEICSSLANQLKSHQKEGVKFLWNRVFRSTEQIQQDFANDCNRDQGGTGAILAHCMGLGKTLTTIVLLHTLFSYRPLTRVHRVLILCPVNTILNWRDEFSRWLKDLQPELTIHLFTCDDLRKENREGFLRNWYDNGGILLMGYPIYRQLTFTADDRPEKVSHNPTRLSKQRSMSDAALDRIRRTRHYLRHPGPDVVICDEAHYIKNLDTAISCTLNRIRTRRRILLTGTPMQNNLREYYAMVRFCSPSYLGTEDEFKWKFSSTIESGLHRDSDAKSVAKMRRRVYALNKHLRSIIHRRSLAALSAFLPGKFEYAVKIRIHPLQRTLYEKYLGITAGPKFSFTRLFRDYQFLMKIWTHPWLLKGHYLRQVAKASFDDDEMDEETDDFDPTDENEEEPIGNDRTLIDWTNLMAIQWWFTEFDVERAKLQIEFSGKLQLMKSILDHSQAIGDKVLLFSRSLIALDYIEEWLTRWTDWSSSFRWIKGHDYFRLDGQTSLKQRSTDIRSFNEPTNSRSRLYLISTRAGGVGINLFAANRVIILDTSWNPADDVQAIFRSYRIGQTKPVFIYRLMVKGTMEEKLYKRQINKQVLADRVVDAKQLPRHFTRDELSGLYHYDFDGNADENDRDDFHRIDDPILRQAIAEHRSSIVAFCEHDSFLIHQSHEQLTDEEKREAQRESKTASADSLLLL